MGRTNQVTHDRNCKMPAEMPIQSRTRRLPQVQCDTAVRALPLSYLAALLYAIDVGVPILVPLPAKLSIRQANGS